ncbi:HlyD family efflux transporter periplasmic adaptor subunit [Pararhodobacter sp. SW119]|uniref:HlyD family efflux transporter periplasmic adaptor subunit n=1 Tax=Pararhodobacter sp. SW119 TaxID=2780075 RepID=UPI001AE039F1|nr:HlyD family efflux transporter periplasmic adaptor subunit [Pararhodobacter sp. SW119]
MAASGDSSAANTGNARPSEGARVSIFDQALWKQFGEASGTDEFVSAWLALQCRLIGGVVRGVVVLGESENGPYSPAATWPDARAPGKELAEIAELALAERRGVVQGLRDEPGLPGPDANCRVAYPFLVDDLLLGVVALELEDVTRSDVRSVMRQLQWGAGWLEVMMRREESRSKEAAGKRTAMAFDLVASALEHERFTAACVTLVGELATQLDCDQVSLGFRQRRHVVVAALSDAALFGKRMNLVRDLGAAMDEAVDQGSVLLYPQRPDWEYRVVRSHAELASRHGAGTILTIPLHSAGRFCGAVSFERGADRPFTDDEIELCDCIATALGPILEEKRRNDRLILWKLLESVRLQLVRLFGPRHVGRKIATAAALGLIAFFSFATGEYNLSAPAKLEGKTQRTLVAPFDGYLAAEYARPGAIVSQGDLLVSLDNRDLMLERLRWSARRQESLTTFDRAHARGERAEARIVESQIAEADAQIDLLGSQLERSQVMAPFDGIVISGDLSQRVGTAVARGDSLFVLAPLDSYRVVLEVDERDISDVQPGQSGRLVLASLPEDVFPYVVERTTPIAEAREGRNAYRVEAHLNAVDPRLKPGMGGVGKIYVEDRLLILVWTARLVDWMRLTVWKWLP